MRVIVDFRVPEDDGWQLRTEDVLRNYLADFGLISPADATDTSLIMEAITEDMKEHDQANFKRSVRYVARQFGGPVASINVLRQGYLRVRLRGYDFGDLYTTGQGLVTRVMQRHGPSVRHGSGTTEPVWQLARCEIRERGGGKGFLFGTWLPGVPSFTSFLFKERRTFFIVGVFVTGLALESVLSFASPSVISSDWTQLGLRLGAPMLVSSAVLLLEKYAQWLDQRSFRLIWSPRPRHQWDQKLTIET